MLDHFAFLNLGLPELILILVIVLLLFGSRKLPDLARSIGSSLGELRKGMNEGERGNGQKSEPEKSRPESNS
ncbi:MAG TPA: twin-arginine translocase TatA/TatE family subunit [Candidatus Saccharimonadales bacterium]|nr:twin-arginine translocase TatA/TatE family subunit [Candidatus Saccharimonadales bacterium]